MEQILLEKTRDILYELGVSGCQVEFIDFSEKARDSSLKARGYDPEYRAHFDTQKRVIEINTLKLNDSNFLHWKNWNNILTHEIGHIIIDAPKVEVKISDDNVGYALARYQFELYNIA